jgi:hypothetical protein
LDDSEHLGSFFWERVMSDQSDPSTQSGSGAPGLTSFLAISVELPARRSRGIAPDAPFSVIRHRCFIWDAALDAEDLPYLRFATNVARLTNL